MLYEDKSKNIHIEANDIRLGENVTLSNNIHIKTFGKFYSHFLAHHFPLKQLPDSN